MDLLKKSGQQNRTADQQLMNHYRRQSSLPADTSPGGKKTIGLNITNDHTKQTFGEKMSESLSKKNITSLIANPKLCESITSI